MAQPQVIQGQISNAEYLNKSGRGLAIQSYKGQKLSQTGKQAISSTEAGNVEMISNSQECIEPSAILNINQLDFADPALLGIGAAVLENTATFAAGPGPLFAPAHGSSSATNKVKKAFEFDFDSQQQPKTNKREKKNPNGPHTNQSSNNNTADAINVGGRKAVSTNKKVSNALKMQQQAGHSMITSSVVSKKINLSKPKTYIKTQMNLTGPLPKHMLSPGPYTNKSKLKTKHSQYFDNSSEIENAVAAQQSQIHQQ